MFKQIIEKDDEGFLFFVSSHKKELLLIITGIGLRIGMLIYYYVIHALIPTRLWGDVAYNYSDIDSIFTGEWDWEVLAYPPLTNFFLVFLKIMAFGIFEIYVFYAFFLEFIVAILFYFVLKQFGFLSQNKSNAILIYLISKILIYKCLLMRVNHAILSLDK